MVAKGTERDQSMTRPHAADDFPAIRARMEELRRERAREPADGGLTTAPRRTDAQAAGSRPSLANSIVFPPAPVRRPPRG